MKNLLLLLLTFTLLTFSSDLAAQTKLQFHNGGLKIAQLTDIHWAPLSPRCSQTEATIKAVIRQEQPDIAVLTGDVVTDAPAQEGWNAIARIFAELQTPFVVLMGNHDAEYASRDDIYRFLTSCPYYIGEMGPDSLTGRGNCVLPVYSSTDADRAEALLYMIDSNDYPTDKRYGHYDFIHFDQIQWYRRVSQEFTQKNNNNPLPALAFFHIPLVEYSSLLSDGKTFGHALEDGVCSADINSGMMASFIDMRDVMGMFVGHDHDNDFVGINNGLLMAYGRSTGTDAYGQLTRGVRIIQLYEGQRKLDTWITTPNGREATYYYPSGINSKDENDAHYMPATELRKAQQGVAYSYYEGRCKHTSDIDKAQLVRTGTMKNFSISEADSTDHFAFVYESMLMIPERGIYRFYTYSDDGSVLTIDGQQVVYNDGGHNARYAEGSIALEAGYHRLQLKYFEDYMGQELTVGICSRNIESQPIPDNMLFLPQTNRE